MEMEFKAKKKDIYIPLRKIVKDVIKSLKALELNIPIINIARMDLSGKLQDETLGDFRKTVYDYLKVTNQYRRLYFDFMKKSKTVFDSEMTKEGSFAPGLKQYESVKNQLFEAILKTDGSAWILSYDQYLPTIREHASKRSPKPRSGKKMFIDLKNLFEKDVKEIKEIQKLSIQISKLFIKDLNLAMKNPEMKWQEWLVNDNYLKIKKRSKKYK